MLQDGLSRRIRTFPPISQLNGRDLCYQNTTRCSETETDERTGGIEGRGDRAEQSRGVHRRGQEGQRGDIFAGIHIFHHCGKRKWNRGRRSEFMAGTSPPHLYLLLRHRHRLHRHLLLPAGTGAAGE
eukprot:113227-Hanusia_phi.AAC.2